METLADVGLLAIIALASWWGWKSGAPKDGPRRPGYLERRPNTSSHTRWGVHPTVREVRRAYLSVRRARGMTGGGWWPRRPRL